MVIKKHHEHILFFMFCFVALLGVGALLLHNLGSNGITSAVTTYVHYDKCTDYGNYIVLENDESWKKIVKDVCTGIGDRYLKRVACVETEYGYYTNKYAEIAYCASGENCQYDENDAAYCPGLVAEIS
ncbi:hypothetical protein COV16_02790 [Candidatus Woesearchaeota archaeon CG10_big_fil_rev_8_21_14_0_10_34_8]|nr:MAG: hypothetical protein COV16_02790 [Candidatus Woesearchaeota archaeon CG10_big_fil_rev_8_21_14_0_10_34_8]